MAEPWHPNALSIEDVADLKDWQLLVGACHFGPTMGDCVVESYGYAFNGADIICHDGSDAISLKDDIGLDDVLAALERYAGFDWREWARGRLRERAEAVKEPSSAAE